MVIYRRYRIPAGTYFFTVNLKNRRLQLLTEHIDLLRAAFAATKKQKPFKIIAIIVLPDHLHTIWELPQGDSHYSSRWQSIKSHFTRHLKKRITLYKNKHGEYDVWQRRYWEHVIRDEDDLNRHIDYIHYNPVKHGYVSCVKDWEYSSFHRFVQKQTLPLNWGDDSQILLGRYGE